MIIKLSPQISNKTLTIIKKDDILNINGCDYDLSNIKNEESIVASIFGCDFIVDKVYRVNNELIVKILLPITYQSSQSACFPDDIINPHNGELILPK